LLPLKKGNAIVRIANDYHKYAEECLRWACDAETDEECFAFLDMARTWIEAAAHHHATFAPLTSYRECGNAKGALNCSGDDHPFGA
jgi:hypothetical protein